MSLPASQAAVPEDAHRVEATGLAIERAARLGFGRPLCLVRAIAFQRLLLKRGIPGSRIRIGVRMNEGSFEAHAWVEWNGDVVGEDPSYVKKFGPLPDHYPDGMPFAWTPTPPLP